MSDDEPRQKTHKEMTFRTELGTKATVRHEEMKVEEGNPINRELADLGLKANPKPDVLSYMGSAAVHIYQSPQLGQLFFISQTQPLAWYRCPEVLAVAAFNHILASMKSMYGHRRTKLRSGF